MRTFILCAIAAASLSACGSSATSTATASQPPEAQPPGESPVSDPNGTPQDKCEAGDAFECFSIASQAAEMANRELNTPSDEDGAAGEAAVLRARLFLKLACDHGNECACAAQESGDCHIPEKCSVKSGDECDIKCSDEPSCMSEAFHLVAGQ